MCQGPGAETHVTCILREHSEDQCGLSGVSTGHILGERVRQIHSLVSCHMDTGLDPECRWDFYPPRKGVNLTSL